MLLVAAVGYYGHQWWTVGRFEEVTDDAFLQADKVTVSPRIAGVVATVMVEDNQPVKVGDVLARIDDRDYQIALTMAEADEQKAEANVLGVSAAITQQGAQIEVARANVDDAQAALSFAGQESARYRNLLQTGSGTLQRQQQTDMDLRQKQAALTKNRASLDSAVKQVESLKALEGGMVAALAGAKAKVEQARLNLTYTTITAPIAGVVGDRSLRVGQFVVAGSNMLTVVPTGADIYLVANLKETQVGDVTVGQPAAFTIDAFGSHEFHGLVASFSPGTGSQFALLPPENATGNFTKIAQRVPVKITLDSSDPLIARLRPGLSADVRIWTKHEDGGAAAMSAEAERASLRDWMAVMAAILGAFTAILDIQITNSSLSNIEGALGASSDEGSWISTAYLMAEIIVIPLTGWLVSVIGLRRYLAVNTSLFVLFSVACALSTSLSEMILFRAGQGFTGGVLIPTAIVIVRTRLPPSQQATGIAIFGLTATFAPAIGPTVGGWLTENFSWQYIFYINLLFGPIAVILQLTALDRCAQQVARAGAR